MTKEEKAIAFYDMIITKNGNPSTKDFRDLGYTEKQAEFAVAQMASQYSTTSEQYLDSAKIIRQKLLDGVPFAEIKQNIKHER